VIRHVVFPVAGLGTRFLPASKAIPKEMITVLDKPLIQHAVEEAKSCGIERFVFVTSKGKEAIENHFDYDPFLERTLLEKNAHDLLEILSETTLLPGQAVFVRQQRPLGLGHAIGCASEVVGNNPFAVILPDDMVLSNTPCLKQMLELYQQKPHINMCAVEHVDMDKVSSYGILDVSHETEHYVEAIGLQEKPEPKDAKSQMAIIGRYILQPTIFDQLKKQKPGTKGEIQITDAMHNLIDKVPFFGFKFQGKRFDCGQKKGWLQANLAFALRDIESRHFVTDFLKEYV
jgi:UTP--glucose-1-phosphate uridylyltransferase